MPRIALLSFTLIALSCTTCFGQAPAVTYFTPGGLQQGTAAELTAGGTVGEEPISVWIDRPGLSIVAGEKQGTLTATAADDTSPGVYLVRIFTPRGASSLRPLMIGSLPETAEVEPNDLLREAPPIKLPATVNARLEKRGDVDCFRVNLKKGQTLVAAIDARRTLGSPMDAVLQLIGEREVVIAQSDDERDRDPAILFTAPRDGEWELRTFAFPSRPNSSVSFSGGETFVYRLTVTTDGFVNHALPLCLNRDQPGPLTLLGWNLTDQQTKIANAPTPKPDALDYSLPLQSLGGEFRTPYTAEKSIIAPVDCSLEKPLAVEAPLIISGQIETPNDADAFQFTAVKGKALELAAESYSLGFPLDPVLRVVNADGVQVAVLDDTSRERDPKLLFRPPADGVYRVEIYDLHRHGGLRYAYRLRIAEPNADFSLGVAADSFVVSVEKPLEIPITVTRDAGFKLPIAFSVESLPKGITCEPVTSEPTGATAKSVKLKLTVAAGTVYAGPLQIVGTASEGESLLTHAPTTVMAETSLAHSHLWLTAPPAKPKDKTAAVAGP